MNRVLTLVLVAAMLVLGLNCATEGERKKEDPEAHLGVSQAADILAGHCSYGTLPTNLTYVQPGYTFRHRTWLMKGNALTHSDEWMALEWDVPANVTLTWNCLRAFVQPAAGGAVQYAWTSPVKRVGTTSTYRAALKLPLGTLAAGAYNVLLAANEQTTTFEKRPIKVSAPLYVVMSVDWDFPADGYLAGNIYTSLTQLLSQMDAFRSVQPDFTYSHFVGPYLWGDPYFIPEISQQAPQRFGDPSMPTSIDTIEGWLKAHPQDEVGVHIHGHVSSFMNNVPVPRCCSTSSCADTTACPSVARPACCDTATCTASIACPAPTIPPRLGNSWGSDGGFPGYSTLIRSYSRNELLAMLNYSSQVLVSRGFKQPTSFRAGGWSGSLDLLAALDSSSRYVLNASGQLLEQPGPGYLVDSSSVATDPEIGSGSVYSFLVQPSGLSSTYAGSAGTLAQPYGGNGHVLEVPDNGSLVDYRDTTGTEAVADLAAVAGASASAPVPLAAPRVYQFGFHPHSLGKGSHATFVSNLTTAVRSMSYAIDAGPAVYARISELRLLSSWPVTGP